MAIVSDLVVSIEGLGRSSWLWVCGRDSQSLVGGEQQGCADLCERSADEIFLNRVTIYERGLDVRVWGWGLATAGIV